MRCSYDEDMSSYIAPLHDDLACLRAFMRGVYAEIPPARGQLQMVAVSDAADHYIYPDKKAAGAFARGAQRQLPQDLLPLRLAECRAGLSFYNPYLDMIFLNLAAPERTTGLDLRLMAAHELGHALDDFDPQDYLDDPQPFERTADAFAVLHFLRNHAQDADQVKILYALRQQICGGDAAHPFNTLPAIEAAWHAAQATDLASLGLFDLARLARAISDEVSGQKPKAPAPAVRPAPPR